MIYQKQHQIENHHEMSGPNLKKKGKSVFLPARVKWFEAEDEEREVAENLLIVEMEMEILCISLKPFRSLELKRFSNFRV